MKRVVLSLGNIGALHDGLGEFALQLGTRVAAQAERWQHDHGVRFAFHMRSRLFGLYGPAVEYLPINRWQRWRHVQPAGCDLWHSLHQLNKTRPPVGASCRVVTVHDLNYRHGRSAYSRWRHHRRTVALMSRTDEVVAISRHTGQDVQQHLGWAGPLQVIYNGARSLVNEPREPLPGWGASTSKPFLFHLSRMSPSKNPQAVVALARAWPEMHFVMCGPEGDDTRQLRSQPHPANLEFHLGISDAQKAWAFAHCTGFLFPSLTEGFGLPPIEAMHFGKPVFLARRTCLPEIGGDAADYFDSFEPQAMRAVVQAGLLRQTQPGRAVAIQAHAAQFDWDRAAAQYLALYGRLLGLPTLPAEGYRSEPA
jgi:glycosyltransferase involved in cell wall biosynthesis